MKGATQLLIFSALVLIPYATVEGMSCYVCNSIFDKDGECKKTGSELPTKFLKDCNEVDEKGVPEFLKTLHNGSFVDVETASPFTPIVPLRIYRNKDGEIADVVKPDICRTIITKPPSMTTENDKEIQFKNTVIRTCGYKIKGIKDEESSKDKEVCKEFKKNSGGSVTICNIEKEKGNNKSGQKKIELAKGLVILTTLSILSRWIFE